MPSTLFKKEYSFAWSKDSMRSATITFMFNSHSQAWDFIGAKFSGVKDRYDLDDWEFLGVLADEIKMLCRREGVI